MLDKQRHLYFDLNAFAELEEMYGSVDAAMASLEQGSVKGIRALVWAGLIHEEMDEKGEPQITQRQVGSWIGFENVKTIAEKLTEALTTAQTGIEDPLPKQVPPGNLYPAKQGSTSGSQ